MVLELETINKLFLELSQIATAKTARELELEKQLPNEDIMTVAKLILEDGGQWAKVCSEITRYNDANEFMIVDPHGAIFEVFIKVTYKGHSIVEE